MRRLGLTVIVDARGSSLGAINCLLEALYTVEASLSRAVHVVHVLADRLAQTLLFKSPAFRPQGHLKVSIVVVCDCDDVMLFCVICPVTMSEVSSSTF